MKLSTSLVILISLLLLSCKAEKGDYVCTPCDLDCDKLSFTDPGTCPHCNMKLLLKHELPENLVLNDVNIGVGSGAFRIEGGIGNRDKPITVFYYKPKNFTQDSKVLMVIPGAGRNGDSYRDAWIEKSEEYGVLILSPMYPENDYQFDKYHLCGLLSDINEDSFSFVENSNIAQLDEELFSFSVNSNSKEWIFNDFDRIFDLVVKETNSNQTSYDIFGHSAGGQILHRMAIFQKDSKANRILASNSGFYTLPNYESGLVFGLKDTSLNEEDLKDSFKKQLVIFLGEIDNENETSGTLLRSQTVDKQGHHRFARGKYFFQVSKEKAEQLSFEFNWKLEIIPNVGHDHEKMGDSAAIYLYAK